MNILDYHAPLKKRVLRAINAPCITKQLRKAIMKRLQIEKIYFTRQTDKSLKAHKKQKYFVSRLCKKELNFFFLIV